MRYIPDVHGTSAKNGRPFGVLLKISIIIRDSRNNGKHKIQRVCGRERSVMLTRALSRIRNTIS